MASSKENLVNINTSEIEIPYFDFSIKNKYKIIFGVVTLIALAAMLTGGMALGAVVTHSMGSIQSLAHLGHIYSGLMISLGGGILVLQMICVVVKCIKHFIQVQKFVAHRFQSEEEMHSRIEKYTEKHSEKNFSVLEKAKKDLAQTPDLLISRGRVYFGAVIEGEENAGEHCLYVIFRVDEQGARFWDVFIADSEGLKRKLDLLGNKGYQYISIT